MKISLLFFSLFSIFFIIEVVSASIYINEVMPDPNTSPYDEWIEIHNPSNLSLNLSEWKLNVSGNLYNITCQNITNCTLITNSTYFIVIWKKASISNITNNSITYYNSSGSGNYWLTNSGAEIYFFNSNYSDYMSYNSSEKGKSWNLNNSEWLKCSPTPGFENFCENNETPDNETDKEQQPEQESNIKITDCPNKAKFSSNIEIEIEIYKGNTNKYAIYFYVQDENNKKVSEKVTLHLRTKYSKFKDTIEIKLDCKNESGYYEIVAEGLDEKDTEKIYLDSCYDINNEVNNEDSIYRNAQTDAYTYNSQNSLSSCPALSTLESYSTSIETESFAFIKILPTILGAVILLLIVYLTTKH